MSCSSIARSPGLLVSLARSTVPTCVTGLTFFMRAGKAANGSTLPEDSIMAQLSIDNVKVEKFVREFLTAQSLTILPQNSFGDAVSQFVDKDDKHAMEIFVNESLAGQIKHLMEVDQAEEDEDEGEDGIQGRITRYRSKLEELFAAGQLKKKVNLNKHDLTPDATDTSCSGRQG